MTHKSRSLSLIALQKFKTNFWGVFSFSIVALIGFTAIFAYVLAPDKSENANQIQLSIHSKPPGFEVKVLELMPVKSTHQSFFSKWFFGQENPSTFVAISDFKEKNNTVTYTEYASDGLIGQSKSLNISNQPYKTYNKTFLLGTDKYGRDLLSRVIIGSRISFSIGSVAVFISLLIGLSLGSIAGYFGGKIDAFIMWVINITWSIPTLLLVIAITLALGKGFWQVFIAVGLTMWVEVARVVRGQIISAKELQYVTAARALGFNNFRIITKHILPNIMAPVIVICAANFAAAILIESGLSFLGIGAQPPMASWGAMIKDHYNYIILGKPYLALVPGFCIMILVMAFMLIGNALRDALDVKT